MAATATLIALSAVSPFLAWHHRGAPTWIYFATLPNLQQLLAGALLAQLWSLRQFERVPSWVLRVGATVGGAAILYLIFRVGDVTFKYLGALTVVAAAGSLIVAHLLDGRTTSLAQRALGGRPVVWLGERSYAVYLWHWPLAEWTNQLPHKLGVPLAFGCTLVAAELSWRLIERPAQRLTTPRGRLSGPGKTPGRRFGRAGG